jgi:hypothetical protein
MKSTTYWPSTATMMTPKVLRVLRTWRTRSKRKLRRAPGPPSLRFGKETSCTLLAVVGVAPCSHCGGGRLRFMALARPAILSKE